MTSDDSVRAVFQFGSTRWYDALRPTSQWAMSHHAEARFDGLVAAAWRNRDRSGS